MTNQFSSSNPIIVRCFTLNEKFSWNWGLSVDDRRAILYRGSNQHIWLRISKNLLGVRVDFTSLLPQPPRTVREHLSVEAYVVGI